MGASGGSLEASWGHLDSSWMPSVIWAPASPGPLRGPTEKRFTKTCGKGRAFFFRFAFSMFFSKLVPPRRPPRGRPGRPGWPPRGPRGPLFSL